MSDKVNARSKAKCDVLRWDEGDLELYYSCTGRWLQNLVVPYNLLNCVCNGFNACCHQAEINKFYNDLVTVLNMSASQAIPVIRCNSSKPYWTAELQQLKEDSIQAHLAWAAVGKPRHGWWNSLRLHAKYKYKWP